MLLEVSRSTYANYEKEQSEPPASQLLKISQFYKVSTNDLLTKDIGAPLFRNTSDKPDSILSDDIRVLPFGQDRLYSTTTGNVNNCKSLTSTMENNFLHKMGFTTKNGLVHNLDEAQNNVERLFIDEAKKLEVPANAVFFRRYYRNDEDVLPYFSTPAVCIFHQSDSFFNTKPHKDLHAALWSAGKTEIYIIRGETRVDIINARKPAKRVGNDVSIVGDDLVLAQPAMDSFDDAKFSAHLFGSGTFWEQTEMQGKIDGNSNPYVFLLDYLMGVRTQLQEDKTLCIEDPTTIDKLLITCILIKFLEEIQDDKGKHTLKAIYKKHKIETEKFEEALRKGVCTNILSDLAGEFNGKIFDTFSDDEVKKISKADLSSIANFLSADVDARTTQIFIWKQYDFKRLPAEVISAIYENFIQAEAGRNAEDRKDVVYTPLHLVNLMIDEAMPLDQPELFKNNTFKVLDPSCGSGVFLVAAYKRMLQWWTINNFKKTGEITITYPDKKVAKQILEDNIFGVDIEGVAAMVSIFGLTTAFLDKLTPKEIWDNLKFKDLSEKNIQGGMNFTDWAGPVIKRNEQFDLVIGNPPFNPSKKGTITNEDLKRLFKTTVPGNRLALKFFEAALYFGKKVCMIIPSNVFLYNKSTPSHKYRKKIFTENTVEKIYDFTHLRRDLFHKTADTPVVSLLIKKTPSKYESIEHIVVKRQLLSEKKMLFEIDYYDKHQVRWDWATDESKQFVWKTNLLGGGRLFHLVYRLSLLETLAEFVEANKKEDPEWQYSSGYKIGGESSKKFPAPYIYLKPSLCTNPSFNEATNSFTTETETVEQFEAPRPEILYSPPLLVFSEVLGSSKLPVQLFEHKQVFNISFVGIHAPIDKTDVLKEIYRKLYISDDTSDTYLAYMLSTSSKLLINKETALVKEDIDNLPLPKIDNYLKTSQEESIVVKDLLKYYRHLGKAISQRSAGKILHDLINREELQPFGTVFCEVLNEIYAEDGKSWQAGQVLLTPTYVRCQFGFGKDGGLINHIKDVPEKEIQTLLNDAKSNKGVNFKRIIRYYNHEEGYDCVYLIKPRARRYWLQSIALRDADDTFMDLKKAGH